MGIELMNLLGGAFGAVIFLAMGAYWLRASRAYQRLSRTAATWPTVPGTIVRSERGLKPTNASDAQRHEANRLLSEQEQAGNEMPVVVYAFEVSGVRYSGQRFNSLARSLAEALELYPLGRAVVVHYRPTNPADCFVDPLGPGASLAKHSGALGFALFVVMNFGPLLVALGVLKLPH